MAAVAIHTVVDIPANTLVPVVRLCFRMAVGALENAVIVWIGVAHRADAVGSAVIHVEPGVVESSIQPARGGVTGGAGGWETHGHMIRTVRGRVVLLMTPVAVGGKRRVVVVYVATRASHRSVSSGQRETRIVVIERRCRPCCRAVTHIALLRKSG